MLTRFCAWWTQSDEEDEGGEWDEDPIAKKRAEREAQLKSDVENAANLLGTAKLGDGKLSSLGDRALLIGVRYSLSLLFVRMR